MNVRIEHDSLGDVEVNDENTGELRHSEAS